MINTMIIDVVEKVMWSKNMMDNDELFNELMDKLMGDTKGFWESYKDVIPREYHILFKKVA